MANTEQPSKNWNKHMSQAIQQAQVGETPFGCVIVEKDKIIAQAFNTVSQSLDPTAHGEINAIRNACTFRQSSTLPKAILFTTGEPCPMCMSAILYAQISQVVFGASIATIAQFMPQRRLSSSEINQYSPKSAKIIGPFMEDDCLQLLTLFS